MHETILQTLQALPLMREKHEGQVRKGMVESTPYRVHPLTLACHALAMGIGDDDVLAALLLHDVVEDTDQRLEELPVNDRVKEAVQLVSYNTYPGEKKTIKPVYYQKIANCPLASLVKFIVRRSIGTICSKTIFFLFHMISQLHIPEIQLCRTKATMSWYMGA